MLLRDSEPKWIAKWVKLLDGVLKNFDDPSYLNSSELARLTVVKRFAQTKYPGQLLSNRWALRFVTITAIDRLKNELEENHKLYRCYVYLNALANGQTRTKASPELGLSHEFVSRTIRPKALKILALSLKYNAKNKKMITSPVTDYEFQHQFPAYHTQEENCMLTISLGLPFEKDDCCYKLVAGVIVL